MFVRLLIFYIYKFSYKFDTVFHKFLETGTSDLLGLDQVLKCLGYNTPFHFPFYMGEHFSLGETRQNFGALRAPHKMFPSIKKSCICPC